MGWLPWWAVLGMLLALALSRPEGGARSVRGPLLLLGAGLGLLVLLPGLRGPEGAVAFTQLFGRVMGGAVLVFLAVTALEGGRAAWGAAWLSVLLLLGALWPAQVSSPVLGAGLLALVLTLLGAVGNENRPSLRLGNAGRALLGVGGAALLGAALVGLLAFAAWPAQTPGQRPAAVSATTGQARPSGEQAAHPEVFPERGLPPASAATSPVLGPRTVLPGTDLALLGGLLLVLALLFTVLRGRVARWRAGTRPQWWEIAALAGLLVTALLVVAFIFAAPGGGNGGGGGLAGDAAGDAARTGGTGSQAADQPPTRNAELLRWLSLISFVVLTTLAGLVFWLGLRLGPDTGEGEESDSAHADPAPVPDSAALHRVRLAYRAALASLAGAGLGRGQAETPAEHARRAARELPTLAGPLGTLVTAYAPVRYGGRVSDEDADAAERAAQDITTLTAGISPGQSRPDPADTESETP
ncbi:DUF4129 domain-containing protein [Deinococcus phoenicis]|nr:DUF4129 domain-containing protein [Deinococcus phoenicis]